MPKLRPKVRSIAVTYDCPFDGPNGAIKTVMIEPNAPGLHAESESCSHCGYEESVTLTHDCPCGRVHYLHLLYRNSG